MELAPGHTLEWTRTFAESEVRGFAELTGDKGAHHVEPDEKGRLMVHGLLTATLPTKLGGDLNYIARTMTFEFLRPVYAGEPMRCVGVVETVEARADRLNVSFRYHVENPRGKRVLEGRTEGIIRR